MRLLSIVLDGMDHQETAAAALYGAESIILSLPRCSPYAAVGELQWREPHSERVYGGQGVSHRLSRLG